MNAQGIHELIGSMDSEWTGALNLLLELQTQDSLSPEECDALIEMLTQSDFDQRSYVVGELAAELIRDRAFEKIRRQFVSDISEECNDWLIHFGVICLHDSEFADWSHLVERACESDLWAVNSYAKARRAQATPQSIKSEQNAHRHS